MNDKEAEVPEVIVPSEEWVKIMDLFPVLAVQRQAIIYDQSGVEAPRRVRLARWRPGYQRRLAAYWKARYEWWYQRAIDEATRRR